MAPKEVPEVSRRAVRPRQPLALNLFPKVEHLPALIQLFVSIRPDRGVLEVEPDFWLTMPAERVGRPFELLHGPRRGPRSGRPELVPDNSHEDGIAGHIRDLVIDDRLRIRSVAW